VIQVISGVILLRSVKKIRDFFNTREDEDCIDTTSLRIHAIAFLFYTVNITLELLSY